MHYLWKKLIWVVGSTLFFLLLIGMVWMNYGRRVYDGKCNILVDIGASKTTELQIFYSDTEDFKEDDSERYEINNDDNNHSIKAEIGCIPNNIRLDFGENITDIYIYSLSVEVEGKIIDVPFEKFRKLLHVNDILQIEISDEDIHIETMAGDPYVSITLEDLQLEQHYYDSIRVKNLITKVFVSCVIVFFWIFFLLNRKVAFNVPKLILSDKRMFVNLAINDFQARFAGSNLGVFWGFFQPFIMLVLYWFVFQVGLRSGNVSSYPFILFLMAGLIPWFYFSEALGGATSSLQEYSYLVKKVVFNVEILPLIKVVSAIFVHLFFVLILLIVCCAYGYWPSVYWLQLVYYIGLNAMFALGLGYITASCMAFFKDMSQIVNIVLTVGVWITPIMWNPNATLNNEWLLVLFKLNPVYYIVDGFRDALLGKEWFWNKPIWSIYSILIVFLVYIVGTKLFAKLKIHFSDVL